MLGNKRGEKTKNRLISVLKTAKYTIQSNRTETTVKVFPISIHVLFLSQFKSFFCYLFKWQKAQFRKNILKWQTELRKIQIQHLFKNFNNCWKKKTWKKKAWKRTLKKTKALACGWTETKMSWKEKSWNNLANLPFRIESRPFLAWLCLRSFDITRVSIWEEQFKE